MHGGWERLADLADRAPARDRSGVVRRLAGYLAPHRRALALAFVFVALGAAGQALGPAIIGLAINSSLVPGGDPAALTRSMILLLAVYVLGVIGLMGQLRIIGGMGQRVLANLRGEVFDQIQALPMRYYDAHDAGDTMSRVSSDTELIGNFLTQGLMQSVGALLGLVAIVAMMLYTSWPLALVTLLVVPLMFAMTQAFSRRARDRYRTAREAVGEVSSNLQEDIGGIREAQAFARSERNIRRFAEANAASRDANVSAVAVTSAFTPAADLLSAVATAIVIGLGGWMAVAGYLETGVVVAFVLWVANFFRPIQQISAVYTQAQAALAGAERIFELLDEPRDPPEPPDAVELPPIAGRIAFEQVRFGYQPQRPVLHEVDFVVEPGQTVAIVGPTGAGKTTLGNLLLGHYRADAGRVTVDGHDLRALRRSSLRRQTGVVPQEVFLFSGSIADNIRYGRPEATDAEVEAAARAVGAHDFIAAQPEGYATLLGERGGRLSAGQRQLIALARAALVDPRLLLLDEATAQIDTRTEALIQAGLEKLFAGRTSLVIAHRLSTVRRADQVIVLSEGRVVERGSHAELLARDGVYADLYRRQLGQAPAAGAPGAPRAAAAAAIATPEGDGSREAAPMPDSAAPEAGDARVNGDGAAPRPG